LPNIHWTQGLAFPNLPRSVEQTFSQQTIPD